MTEKTAWGPPRDEVAADSARVACPRGLVLAYHLDEPISLVDAPSFMHVERWTVTVLVDRPGTDDDRREIGYARLVLLNLEAGVELADLADTASGEWVEVTRDHVRRVAAVARALEESEAAAMSVLVLDRLWIEPAYRGNGLGPIVAASAIVRLGRGCRLAACYPAPFETAQADEDRERSVEALGRIWAKVGFTLWNDGVWMLDLHSTDLHDAVEHLLRDAADSPDVPGARRGS